MTRRPLPSRLVRLAAALAVLALSACGGETPAAPAGTDWITDAGLDTTEASALLGLFASDTIPEAFARLAERPHRAEVTLVEYDPGTVGSPGVPAVELGTFRRELVVEPGSPPRVVAAAATGSLSDTTGLDPARLLPSNPFPELLPDDLPFLDRRTRSAYRLTVRQDSATRSVRADVDDETADRPLVRSARVARDADSGRLSFDVDRRSASAIYDEWSRGRLELVRTERGLVPASGGVRIETATPLQRRHLFLSWVVTLPPATSPREP